MTKARDNANGGLGLILIKPSSVVNGTDNGKGTITFSAASTVSLNNVFNSTYTNYRVIINMSSASATNSMKMRLRSNSTDDTAGNYAYAGLYVRSDVTGITSWRDPIGQTYFHLGDFNSSRPTVLDVDIHNPNLATQTTARYSGTNPDTSNYIFWFTNMNYHSQATAYDGFTIFPLSGTINGTVSVYGIVK